MLAQQVKSGSGMDINKCGDEDAGRNSILHMSHLQGVLMLDFVHYLHLHIMG